MEGTMTVKDVLKDVIETLNNISVPMSQINDIGLPIAKSINNIKACVEAMESAEKDQAEKETAEAGDENA